MVCVKRTTLQVRADGATGVLAFRGDGSRHGFTVAVLALQPEGLVQVGTFGKLSTSLNCGGARQFRERASERASDSVIP